MVRDVVSTDSNFLSLEFPQLLVIVVGSGVEMDFRQLESEWSGCLGAAKVACICSLRKRALSVSVVYPLRNISKMEKVNKIRDISRKYENSLHLESSGEDYLGRRGNLRTATAFLSAENNFNVFSYCKIPTL